MRTGWLLGACVLGLVLSLLGLRLTQNGNFAMAFFGLLVPTMLFWFDLGRELRAARNRGPLMRALGLLMGVPQALLGLACACAGLGILLWVLYNVLVERQPGYSGGLLILGAPTLMVGGIGLLASAFRRGLREPDDG